MIFLSSVLAFGIGIGVGIVMKGITVNIHQKTQDIPQYEEGKFNRVYAPDEIVEAVNAHNRGREVL